MKLAFRVEGHLVECNWWLFGKETYRVDGEVMLQRWSLATRGARRFPLGAGSSRMVTLDVAYAARKVALDVSLDGKPVTALSVQGGRLLPLTLIELAMVAGIIGILAALAVPPSGAPSYLIWNMHGAVRVFDETVVPNVLSSRERHKRWPAGNRDLDWPAEGFRSEDRHVFAAQGDGGILLRVSVPCGHGGDPTRCKPGERYEPGQVSFRPAVNERGETVFVCGREKTPAGYTPVGKDLTTLRGSELPQRCR